MAAPLGAPASRVVLDTLSWLIDQAFQGDPSHSLLANLQALQEDDWISIPSGGQRSIAEILEHVGWSKWMYEDYAFGPASMRGDQPPLVPAEGASSRPRDELLAWLHEGHRHWLGSVRGLPDDSALSRDRLTNWGELLPTRDIIRIMIAHDFYHAGEINHIRSLLQKSDA